jgi:hypothetical protein
MLAGGLLAGGYVLLVLGKLMTGGTDAVSAHASSTHIPCKGVSQGREVVVLAMALCAVALGFAPLEPSALLQIGRATVVEVGAR